MKSLLLITPLALTLCGCAANAPSNASPDASSEVALNASSPAVAQRTLAQARQSFQTKLVPGQDDKTPAEVAPAAQMQTVKYAAAGGQYTAYLSNDPRDGKKHPAIVWITGGDSSSIGDVWSPQNPANDQSAAQFRAQGVIMMFPSLRGGNANAGAKEGFLGEADDVLRAADFLAQQPFVDPQQIYLGGHSTGGTLALLVAEQSSRFRAIFAFGAVDDVAGYGADSGYLPFDISDAREVEIRSPIHWLNGVKSPTYLLEGTEGNSNIASLRAMRAATRNPNLHFLEVTGRDHFSALAPANAYLARAVEAAAQTGGALEVTQSGLDGALRAG